MQIFFIANTSVQPTDKRETKCKNPSGRHSRKQNGHAVACPQFTIYGCTMYEDFKAGGTQCQRG